MDDLTLALAAAGGIAVLGVVAYNSWQIRKAGPKRADQPRSRRRSSGEPEIGDAGRPRRPVRSTQARSFAQAGAASIG